MTDSQKRTVTILEEPALRFGFGQSTANPKEGLFLFGPIKENSNPVEIRCGVIGTPKGITAYRGWVDLISKPISSQGTSTSVFYPGFRELFNCGWNSKPVVEILIPPAQIATEINRPDRHGAIHATVTLFADRIDAFLRDEDRRVDLWFVVIPDDVFTLGRPNSRAPGNVSGPAAPLMNARLAKKLQKEPSLFQEDMQAAVPYEYEVDFHNQLKARLIRTRAITQVIRESTLGMGLDAGSSRRMQDPATIAWNLSVSSFYKAGGRPWRLNDVRGGVCYVGLVFKRDSRSVDETLACCGAQMFLTSGEGMVFKGTGRFYSPSNKEFHLARDQAKTLGTRIVNAYEAAVGEPPKELFLHGRTRFNDEEWAGFQAAMPAGTEISGVRITRSDEFKLYRPDRMPVIRGTVALESQRLAYLWTSGYVPELSTYPGWEVPNPLRIELSRGSAPIDRVVRDVFQLTKLNFNACIYADGLPVTLRFADAIGEILTAAPQKDIPDAPLPFRHYI